MPICACGVSIAACISGCRLHPCCGGLEAAGHMSDCVNPDELVLEAADLRLLDEVAGRIH